MNEEYFSYTRKEIDYLKQADKTLAGVIDKLGFIKRRIYPDLFSALVYCIVGQQISTKVQETLWQRILSRTGEVTPAAVRSLSEDELRSMGISLRKAFYIRNAAEKILRGEFEIDSLREMTDSEACARLVELEGIGEWSAQMLLIFSLGRMNVLSFGDLGIQRGLRMLYRHRKITRELFDKYRRRFSPYCSVASLYLWEVASGAIPGMKDCAPIRKKKKLK